MFVILFFVLLIAFQIDNVYMFTWIYKEIYFLEVCFSSKLANCKCTHGTKSAKLNALENPLLCSQIIYISL